MFNVQTINCMQYSEPAVIQTRLQSHNEINIWPILNKEKRKQGNKKEKLTESVHLTVKIARRLNDNMTLVLETSHKQNHCRNHKAALNEKPTDSPQWFFIRSSI